MTTILHVSDLHFGAPAVLEQIAAVRADIERGGIDLVAVSGDFSQRSLSGEFQCGAMFLDTARAAECAVVTVPGNHDVAWWYAPLGIGWKHKVLERYRKYISQDIEPVVEIPGATVVGINTSHGIVPESLTKRVRDLSIIGLVTEEQLERTRARLRAIPPGNARIVMMHHNPVAGRLSQRYGIKHPNRIMCGLAEAGAELVLCGHDHEEQVKAVDYDGRRVIVITGGTLSNRSRGGRPSAYYFIKVTPEQYLIEPRIWSPDAGRFLPHDVLTFSR